MSSKVSVLLSIRAGKQRIIGSIKTILIFFQIAFEKTKYKSESNVYLFSDPRGGSTWLMEILSRSVSGPIVWEPLHTKNGLLPKKLKIGFRPYIPESINWPEAIYYFRKVFEHKCYNWWSTKYTSLGRCSNEQMLIKFIKGNALLPWLTKNFDFSHKPILLLRHPVAVALSQIKAFPQDWDIDEIIKNQSYPDLYLKHRDFFCSLETQLERQVAVWCLHNCEVINHVERNNRWITIYYEHLVLDPIPTLKSLFNDLSLQMPAQIQEQLKKRSQTDFKNDLLENPMDQISKWESLLNPEEKGRVQEVLDYFKIDVYRSNSCTPFIDK